ncbi:hypothetical protein [Pleomorphomonas sp. PLEO]|uniref:hypothetical protein n=1 Tax=Pleomorphomonas sp. PLEO TaxID=3239306 RepID=UPI00351E12AC
MARWNATRNRWISVALVLMAATPSFAQNGPPPGGPGGPGIAPMPGFMPSGSGPLQLLPPPVGGPAEPLPEAATPYAPSTAPAVEAKPLATTAPRDTATLALTARLTPDGPPIGAGVVWRIFNETQGPDGSRELVAERHGGSADFVLKPGGYFVYCGFGYAGTTEHVVVGTGLKADSVILNAGGVRLSAVTGKDKPPLDEDDLSFDIFSQELDSHGEPKAVALDVSPGDIVRLPAKTYNVVANYGDANARTTADIDVKAGKLSDITLTEKAAKITLKLVSTEGGEAIANTRWSVLTQAGDLVTSGVGAFPSFVLAEGDYTVIANHEDGQFQRIVSVVSGEDADVEVLATDSQKATN